MTDLILTRHNVAFILGRISLITLYSFNLIDALAAKYREEYKYIHL